jgi:glycosyltransferase involved in cell wall biosynthesis
MRARRAPGFSIIIPTYNRAAFLERALDSVLCQIRPADEVIVVDDGSDDDTPRILAKLGDRITVIHAAHGGAGRARNLGLERARKPLVAFLDSDDEWLPGKLDVQRAFMAHRPDVLYCFTNFRVENRNGSIQHRYLDRWPREHRTWEEALGPGRSFALLAPLPRGVRDFPVYEGDLYRWQLTGCYVLTDTLVVRREQAGDALRFPEDLATYEDLECFVRLSRRGRAAYLDIETAHQRDHDGGRLSQIDRVDKLDARIQLINRVWGADKQFLKRHSALYRRTLQELQERRIKAMLVDGHIHQAKAELAKLTTSSWQLRLMAQLPVPLSRLALQLRNAVQANLGLRVASARGGQEPRQVQPQPTAW